MRFSQCTEILDLTYTSSGKTVTVAKGTALNGTTISSAGSSSSNAVTNWWGKLPTVAVSPLFSLLGASQLTLFLQHVGIIIGGVAVFLICLIGVCTCFAKRNDKKKRYAQVDARANAGSPTKDNIPLVEKQGTRGREYNSTPTPAYSPELNRQESSFGYSKEYSESQGSFYPPEQFSQGQPRTQYGGGGYGAGRPQYNQPSWGPRR